MTEFVYSRNCEVFDGTPVPEGMRRVVLQVEYDGSPYCGFQRQLTAPNTVQAELERALSSVANEPVTVVCAGRTDAGVHATSQIVHFDTLASRPSKAWLQGVNTHLPFSIRVISAKEVGFDFHARFSALSRTYRYVIHVSQVRSAHLVNGVTWVKLPQKLNGLDVPAMQEAASLLLGEHDFTSFRTVHCQAASPVRTMEVADVVQVGEFIVVQVTANAFLHHMVRNIVGVLLRVGRGELKPSRVTELIALRDRSQAAETAPAAGLYFVNVQYPERFAMPTHCKGPIFLPL